MRTAPSAQSFHPNLGGTALYSTAANRTLRVMGIEDGVGAGWLDDDGVVDGARHHCLQLIFEPGDDLRALPAGVPYLTQGMPPADIALSWLGAGPALPPLVAGTATAGTGTVELEEAAVAVPREVGMVKLAPMVTLRAPTGTDAPC